MTRYLSGLCVAGLGLCGGGWLIVATEAFGGADAGGAGRVNLATGAVLILASCVAMIAWALASSPICMYAYSRKSMECTL